MYAKEQLQKLAEEILKEIGSNNAKGFWIVVVAQVLIPWLLRSWLEKKV